MAYVENNSIIPNNICSRIVFNHFIRRKISRRFDLFIPKLKFLLRIRVSDPKISQRTLCNYSHKMIGKINNYQFGK